MWQGTLCKMLIQHEDPLSYTLHDAFGGPGLELSDLLGSHLSLRHNNERRCVHCGSSTNRLFGEGSCYPCFTTLPQNDICILKPELCHYHDTGNPCRDAAWGERHCFQPHVLYLAVSSGLKVGITRQSQVPVRWMDQGASQALPVLRVADRLTVGRLEHALAAHIPDKTHWQRMLRHELPEVDLMAERQRVLDLLDGGGQAELLEPRIWSFTYPSLAWPTKVKSLGLEKLNRVEGRLMAIKGQYLILDNGVINIRKHSGWCVQVEVLP